MKSQFAKQYKIQYGCVIDHDAYESLRISIEASPDTPETRGEVFLNGRAVGLVDYLGKKQFLATRYRDNNQVHVGTFPTLGKATAGIISDFITP